MNNFKIIYKILKAIELSIDCEEFDKNSISPEVLGITQELWKIIINELAETGYIKSIALVPILGSLTKEVKIMGTSVDDEGKAIIDLEEFDE